MAGHTGEGAEQQLRPSTVLDAEEKQSSGMERLIKREQLHHIKNSEKRILARKLLNINSVLKTLLVSSNPSSSRKLGVYKEGCSSRISSSTFWTWLADCYGIAIFLHLPTWTTPLRIIF
uniref:Uncharacterized protein LOC104236868 isoform X1 n=1 Tax=Nicotiana sylvestris TaxID=4096 RepID=A0A1U7XRT8_NICSY|nr:PREDICTED: uncharacterized protein LOC104236868 isoform X1 [Nicotiana sylvestris]